MPPAVYNPRPLPVQLWDWAIMLLLLASLGAAGLVGLVFSRADNLFLQQLFLHQFLDLFAVGWFNLAVLGVFWWQLGRTVGATALPRWLPTMSLALVLAPTFVLGISPALLPPHTFWMAAAANVAAAILLAIHGVRYLRRAARPVTLPGLHLLAFGALGVIIAIAFLLLIPGVWANSAAGPLRIFYLHDLLLGWVSSSLLILIDAEFALVPWRRLRLAIYASVGVGRRRHAGGAARVRAYERGADFCLDAAATGGVGGGAGRRCGYFAAGRSACRPGCHAQPAWARGPASCRHGACGLNGRRATGTRR